MDSKTKTPFLLFFSPRAMMSEAVFVTICLDFCTHLFWCSTRIILNFFFSISHEAGGYRPEFFCFFFVFSSSPTCVPLLCRWPRYQLHSFCSKWNCQGFILRLSPISPQRSLFSTLSRKTLWSMVRISFSLITITFFSIQTFDRPGGFFCHFSLNPICWLIAVRVQIKLRFSENHFPTSVTLPTITPHRHGFEEFGFGLWKFLSRHSDMMGLNSEIFSFKLSQSYVMVFNINNYSLKLSCTCNC